MKRYPLKRGSVLLTRYDLEARIAAGGEGAVWSARDRQADTQVAVKILADADDAQKTAWESLCEVLHPGLVCVFDAADDPDHGVFVVAMEHLEGPRFDEALRDASPTARDALVTRALEGLAALHRSGLIHGDLKPDNILVADDDGDLRPVLIDFGLTERRGAATLRGATPAYMAPELLAGGKPDAASDLYAFGLTVLQGIGSPDTTQPEPKNLKPATMSMLLERLLPRLVCPRDQRHLSADEALTAVAAIRPDLPIRPLRQLPFIGRTDLLNRILTPGQEARPTRVIGLAGRRGFGRARTLAELGRQSRTQLRPFASWHETDDRLEAALRITRAAGIPASHARRRLAIADGEVTNGAGRISEIDIRWANILADALETVCQDVVIGGPVSGLDGSLESLIGALLAALRRRSRGPLVLLTGSPEALERYRPDRVETLTPWSLAEVDELIGQAVPHLRKTTVRKAAERVHAASGGQPALAISGLQHLIEHDFDAALLASDSPLLKQTAGLPAVDPKTMTALEALHVHEGDLDLATLRRLGIDQQAVATCIRMGLLVSARHVERGASLKVPEWVRTAVADGIGEEARRRRHERLADVLTRPDARLHHRLRSGSEVSFHEILTGVRTASERSPSRGLDLLEKAMADATPSPEARLRLEYERGTLLLRLGLLTEARASLRRVVGEGPSEIMPEARSRLADLELNAGNVEAAERIARTTCEVSPQHAGAWLTLSWILLVRGKPAEAEGAADTALGICSTDAVTAALARNIRGTSRLNLGRLEQARDDLTSSHIALAEAGRSLAAAGVASNLGLLDMREGRLQEADSRFASAEAACVDGGHHVLLASVLSNRGIAHRMMGRPERSAELQRNARRRFLQAGESRRAAMTEASEGLALFDAGHLMDAWRALRSASRGVASPSLQVRILSARARLAHILARRNFAVRLATRALWAGRRADPRARAEARLAVVEVSLNGPRKRRRLARALREARRCGDTRIVAEACVAAAALHLDKGRHARGKRSLTRGAARHPMIEARRCALLARCTRSTGIDAGGGTEAEAATWIAAGLRVRPDRMAALDLRIMAAHHLTQRGRRTAAARCFGRAHRALVDMEDGMSKRQADTFRRSLFGTEAAELLVAIQEGLDSMGRGGHIDLARERRDLLRAIASLNEAETRAGLLDKILDALLQLTRAERAVVALAERDRLRFSAARRRDGTDEPAPEEHLSTTVVHDVMASARSVVVADAESDPKWRGLLSVASHHIRALACVPLRTADGKPIGALYLDGGLQEGIFREGELPVIEAFADLAALAIRNLERKEQANDARDRLVRALDRRAIHPVGQRLIGQSASFKRTDETITKAAASDLNILIMGESGTGKELFAKALHDRSARRQGPWVAESCAALPASLFESELFGHAEGAFTGANASRPGLIQKAHGGTLFLDEVGELPVSLQARLLRTLQQREVRPIGARSTVKVDFRLVAATNRNLEHRVEQGLFREDFYYRLRGIAVEIPPLRKRKDDIDVLADHFLDGTGKRLRDDARGLLRAYGWPGNVRQLQNELARACALCEGDVIGPSHLSPDLQLETTLTGHDDDEQAMPLRLVDWERRAVGHALRQAGGDRKRAAALLGISRSTLYTKIDKLGLQ